MATKFSLFFLILFSSCSYHMGAGGSPLSLSIPYASGDENGLFTEELIQQTLSSYPLSLSEGSDKELIVCLKSPTTTTIGYKKDPMREDGTFKDNLRSSEARQEIKADVSIFSRSTGQRIWGPYEITASSEYDYVNDDSLEDLSFITPNGQRETALRFSLGQLEGTFPASRAARAPLYRALAQKIIERVTLWDSDEK